MSLPAANILEITPDEGVQISLEMVDECQAFIHRHINSNFAILINQVNDYNYSFEAQLSVGSYENLVALAFVYYTEKGRLMTEQLAARRRHDNWNYQVYSGLNLGWQEAFSWLQGELKQLAG